MDVRMPGMDGTEATRQIRALAGIRGRVPIVALTAQAFTDQVAACRAAGMDSHLAKPFDPDTLLGAVLLAAAMGHRQIHRPPEITPGTLAAIPVHPALSSELPVLDQALFGRTAVFLEPRAVASYLKMIAADCETLLIRLRTPGALSRDGLDLAETAHALAGSAGMFGLERLTALASRFVRAVQTGAAEAPAIASGLEDAVEASLPVVHARIGDLVAAP